MMNEHDLFDLNSLKCIEICFMTHIIIYLHNWSMFTSKDCFYFCWVEYYVNANGINLLNLGDYVVQLFCILIDFIYRFYQFLKEIIEIYDKNCGFVYFSFQFYQLHVF